MSKKGIDTHQQYKENHRINDNRIVERRCSICQKWKEETLDNFYMKNKKKPEMGYTSACKKCTSDIRCEKYAEDPEKYKERTYAYRNERVQIYRDLVREWRKNNLDRKRNYLKEYYISNPDKFKIYIKNHRIHDITESEWRNELKVFDYCCIYCDISEEESKKIFEEKLHKDHVDNEGYNDIRNAVPACKSCNSQKWESNMEEWFRKQEFFSEEKLQFIKWWTTEGYKDYIEDKPPYRIIREKNDDNKTYHFNLWSVDEKRNTIEIIATENKKKDLNIHIKNYLK